MYRVYHTCLHREGACIRVGGNRDDEAEEAVPPAMEPEPEPEL
jgi:hypothetical protein